MAETRSDRFKRLAIRRTNAVLDKLRLLGNLSNKSSYDYTDEELNRIFAAVESQLKLTKSRFNKGEKRKFSL